MAAALIRRVISPALLSSSPRPVRTVSELLSTRFYRTSFSPDDDVPEIDSNDDRIVFYSTPRNIISKDTAEGVYLSMEMPGVKKEDIKVRVEQNYLVLKGILKKDSAGNELAVYRYILNMTALNETCCFKLDAAKAEMKSGVLQVFIPLNEEEARERGLILPM